MTQEHTTKAKTLEGIVSSDKMKDTVVVVVERYVKHPKYQKFVQSRKKYKVHDEGNKAKVGGKVVIIGTRPISRHKSFRILEIQPKQ